MIDFKPVNLNGKVLYEHYLHAGNERGCEYTFANLFMWGQQNTAHLHDHIILFSQFNGRSVYPYPIGRGDKKAVLDEIIADSKDRGVPCLISGMRPEEKQTLEELYPGMFSYQCDRDTYDYVYSIDDLADLKGRKYHGKRNHCHRFCDAFPNYTVSPLNDDNLHSTMQMANLWYRHKQHLDPNSDFEMEKTALDKAFRHYKELGMDGLVLQHREEILAFTMGSRLAHNTFDVHYEKARWDADGAYAVINCEFAKYIRSKYPQIRFLNREEDMGLEGLRKAKLSYHPHHMVEKCKALLLNDGV